MATYTDAVLVEDLLSSAIGVGSTPDLSAAQLSLLLTLAMPGGIATSETLQRATVTAWAWKAALTADAYDLTGQGGAKLTESQWHAQCAAMAERYRRGILSVDGETLGDDLGAGDLFGDPVTFTTDVLTGSGMYDAREWSS